MKCLARDENYNWRKQDRRKLKQVNIKIGKKFWPKKALTNEYNLL